MRDMATAPPRSSAGIAAFRDHAALITALRSEIGVDIPVKSAFIRVGDITLSCVAPARYLVSGHSGAGLPGRLAKSLQNLAAVTDQSDLWHTIILSGPGAREALARVVSIDVHPAQFPPGQVALTRAGHLDIRLWHLADDIFEVAVSRSYADDLAHALRTPA